MRQLIHHFWKENLVIVFLILGAGIATTVASFINAAILNSLVALDSQRLNLNMTYLIIVYAFFLVATYFQMKQLEKTTQKMSNYLRFKILGKITTMSPKQFREHNEGHYTSWLSNDINQIEQLGFEKFYELLSGVVNLILSVIDLVYIHWSILIVTVIEVILIIQLPNLFVKKIEQATEKITEANEQFMSKSRDFLSGFSTFYVFNNPPYLMNEIKKFYELRRQEKFEILYHGKSTDFGCWRKFIWTSVYLCFIWISCFYWKNIYRND